jgi:hypothetical protein
MDVPKANRRFPATASPGAETCVTLRLDREDAGRLSRVVLGLLSGEALASAVAPIGFDEQATLTLALAQLRRQLREA